MNGRKQVGTNERTRVGLTGTSVCQRHGCVEADEEVGGLREEVDVSASVEGHVGMLEWMCVIFE